MNTAPVLSWSNFPLKSIFVPLINKSAFYLASKDRTENEHLVSSGVNIDVSDQSIPQIMIEKPNKSQEFIDLKEKNNPNFISYQNTNIPGDYHIYSGKKIFDDFAVNVDPVESVTKYVDNNEFEDYLHKINFKGHYIKVDKKDIRQKLFCSPVLVLNYGNIFFLLH